MRPVDKSLFTTNKTTYTPYGDAKTDLISALGCYCSYCERQGFPSALDVEHVEDKNAHPQKMYSWSNFLLACKNCNSIKGTQQVDFDNILMPHLNDTYHCIEYKESGLIDISNFCASSDLARLEKLIDLVGLDRRPGHPKYSTKDNRWEERKQNWTLAKRYLLKYEQRKVDAETIKDFALKSGFWSIWMHAFARYPEVQRELITAFAGTNVGCF